MKPEKKDECEECLDTGRHRDEKGHWTDQPCWTCEDLERLRRGWDR